jgi:oligopeptide transport system substrate-binding protein
MSAELGTAPIRVNGAQPQNGLVPANTVEGHGTRLIDLLFTGLYHYDADGAIRPAMLESLQTADHRHYTVSLRPGWRFTDGTPVTAASYVDAWNYAADPSHAQALRGFFAPIEGYRTVTAEPPTASGMAGLRVLGELSFSFTLEQPDRDFPDSLGSPAARPLPRVFFELGPERFGEHPVGNGPYQLAASDAWHHGERLDLVPNPDYPGPDAAANDGITFVFYQDLTLAYADLRSGRLDVLDSIPDSLLPRYVRELGERAVLKPIALNNHLAIPCLLPHFSGPEGRLRRAAISHAVDRRHLTEQVLHCARAAAHDFTCGRTAGPLPGASVLRFDPLAAKNLWAEADEIAPWSGVFELAYNESGGYDVWIGVLAGQISRTLGIEVSLAPFPTFKSIRDRIADKTLMSAFRTGWRGDYPSAINFLGPLFAEHGGANETGYHSAEFEAELAAAKQAPDARASLACTDRAQAVLLRDLPAIPLWNYLNAGGRGESVTARFKWNGMPDYPGIRRV